MLSETLVRLGILIAILALAIITIPPDTLYSTFTQKFDAHPSVPSVVTTTTPVASHIRYFIPAFCTVYNRIASHLSSKTPYDFRPTSYPYSLCRDNHALFNAPTTTPDINLMNTSFIIDPDFPCHGSLCPQQFQQLFHTTATQNTFFVDMAKISEAKQCRLKHITHVNRHGSRGLSKPTNVEKLQQLIHNGLKENAFYDDEVSAAMKAWVVPNGDDILSLDSIGALTYNGHLELYGIGNRIYNQLNVTGSFVQDIIAQTTHKERTLQSLSALLAGLRMYTVSPKDAKGDIMVNQTPFKGLMTQSHHKHKYKDGLDILQRGSCDLDGDCDAIHIELSYDLIQKGNIYNIVMEFENQLVTKAVEFYGLKDLVNYNPNNGVTLHIHSTHYQSPFAQNQHSVVQHFRVTIPNDKKTGLSPLITLYAKYHPDFNLTKYLAEITEKHFSYSEQCSHSGVPGACQDRSWFTASTRYFDECCEYNPKGAKDSTMHDFKLHTFGMGSLADIVLHNMYTHQYLMDKLNRGRFDDIIIPQLNATRHDSGKFNELLEALITASDGRIPRELIDSKINALDLVMSAKGKEDKKAKKQAKVKADHKLPLSLPKSLTITDFISFAEKLFPSHDSDYWYKEFQKNDAKIRFKMIKSIYEICLFDAEAHSHTLYPHVYSKASLSDEKHAQGSKYLRHVCQFLTNDALHDVIAMSTLEQYNQGTETPLGFQIDSVFDKNVNETKYYELLTEQIATAKEAEKTTTDYYNTDFDPFKSGSKLLYYLEYEADYTQIRKQGPWSNDITLAMSCPLLEELFSSHLSPDYVRGGDNGVTMSLYAAHAETILPAYALLLNSSTASLDLLGTEHYHVRKPVQLLNDPYEYRRIPQLLRAKHKYIYSIMRNETMFDHFYNYNPSEPTAYHYSYAAPMGANLAVHFYDCVGNDNVTREYAALIHNEENIPWPSQFPKGKSAADRHHDIEYYGLVKMNIPQQPDQEKTDDYMVIPFIRPTEEVHQGYKNLYMSLGMGECVKEDFYKRCDSKLMGGVCKGKKGNSDD